LDMSCLVSYPYFLVYLHRASFPTRRSSDLVALSVLRAVGGVDHQVRVELRPEGCDSFGIGEITGMADSARRGRPSLRDVAFPVRSEEHTSELQSRENLVCHLLLEKQESHLR